MSIVLVVIGAYLLINFLPDIIGWLRWECPKRRRTKKQIKEKQRYTRNAKMTTTAQCGLSNVLELTQDAHYKQARFENGIVYAVVGTSTYKIGSYDASGIVYSADSYEIGKVSDGIVSLNRLGDLKRYIKTYYNKTDEGELTDGERAAYAAMCKATELLWTCAEVFDFGRVNDFRTGDVVATVKYTRTENEKSAVGYGACFICLQYMTMQNTAYSMFYCPLGTRFRAIS